MNIDNYMKERVDEQISWYEEKAAEAQKYYRVLKTAEIVLAVLIPLMAGYATHRFIAFLIGLFGAAIVIIEVISRLNKYHENWMQYRLTGETLRYQKNLFLTGSGPYSTGAETMENVFVKNVEGILTADSSALGDIKTIKKEVPASSAIEEKTSASAEPAEDEAEEE